MTLLLCIGLFSSTNGSAYFTEETIEKEFIDLFVSYINNECYARNFDQRIWYL